MRLERGFDLSELPKIITRVVNKVPGVVAAGIMVFTPDASIVANQYTMPEIDIASRCDGPLDLGGIVDLPRHVELLVSIRNLTTQWHIVTFDRSDSNINYVIGQPRDTVYFERVIPGFLPHPRGIFVVEPDTSYSVRVRRGNDLELLAEAEHQTVSCEGWDRSDWNLKP